MRNTFGNILTLTTFGESHGPAIGGIIDGFPAGVKIDTVQVQQQLDRRRPGQSAITTARHEDDKVQLLSKVTITELHGQSSSDDNTPSSPAATKTYMIVSPHEANLHEGKISIKSPIAHALLNKAAGDVVEVHVPAGTMRLRIESIEM